MCTSEALPRLMGWNASSGSAVLAGQWIYVEGFQGCMHLRGAAQADWLERQLGLRYAGIS